MSKLLKPECILTTSSDERYPGSNATDSKNHTFFLTTGSYPQEMLIGFPGGSSANINKVMIRMNGVKSLRIEKTTENLPTGFGPLVECELNEKPGGFQIEQFQINKETAGKGIHYLKIVIVSGYEQFSCISEIAMEGEGGVPPPVVENPTTVSHGGTTVIRGGGLKNINSSNSSSPPPQTKVLSNPPPRREEEEDGGQSVILGDLAEDPNRAAAAAARRRSSGTGSNVASHSQQQPQQQQQASSPPQQNQQQQQQLTATGRKPNALGLSLQMDDEEEEDEEEEKPPQKKGPGLSLEIEETVKDLADRPTVSTHGTVTAGTVVVSSSGVTMAGNKMELDPEELDFENADNLGRGSSGAVKKVRHIPSGKVMALKEIKVNNEHHLIEIQKELETLHGGTMGKPQHPNLIEFYGAYSKEGSVYIAMECMDGSLASFRNVPEPVLAKMTKQMLKGFHYLHHDRHLIHRDIKPGNVLWSNNGDVKITDFGVSSSVDNTAGHAVSFVGTVTYMSPERLNGDAHGWAGDIWSLGISLCELALGMHPYQGLLVNEKGEKNEAKFWSLLSHMNSGEATLKMPENSSTDFQSFIGACCTKDPNQRADAQQLLDHPWIKNNTGSDTGTLGVDADKEEIRNYIQGLAAAADGDQVEAVAEPGSPDLPKKEPVVKNDEEKKKLNSALDGLAALA